MILNLTVDLGKGKIAGLVQKPQQQFGLMKRGLGGMTNEELQESRITYKKEPHHVQAKPAKITAMSLTIADVQQRIGTIQLIRLFLFSLKNMNFFHRN